MKLLVILFLLVCVLVPCLAITSSKKEAGPQTVLILLGAPGAGKGTQAVRLSEKYGLPQIATGDLFRENLKNETEIGRKAKTYMEKGELVPDEVVLEMLFQRLSQKDCRKGYILDGVPRTIPQAEILQNYLTHSHADVTVLSLEVPDSMILERIAGRLSCEKCGAPYHLLASPPKKSGVCDRCNGPLIQRKDDTPEVIGERLKAFHLQTEPLKEYYQKKGHLVMIDGTVSKQETIAQIDKVLSTTPLFN